MGDGRSLLCLWSWQSLGLPTVILSRAGRSTTMRLQRMPPGISRESLCVCLLMWNCLNHGKRIAPRARTGFSTITRSLASLPGTVHRWRLLRSLNLVQIVPRLLALMMVRSQLIRSTVLQRWMTVGASSPNPSGDLNSCDGRLKHLRPKDARLEILAGDLVLKSANAVSSTDSRSDPRQPVQTSDSTRPTQFVESPAASSRSTPTSATSTPAAPRRGVKRGSQTGAPPCDPRKRPPSFWFMEDDPDDTPAPPPKVKAKPKAKPRTAEAKARMMSTLLKISRANRARAVAAATEKTGAVDSPLPREPCSSVVPSCRSTLSNSNWLDGTSLRSCLMRSRWDDTGTRCVSATLPYALPPAVCRCLPHYRACLHQAADLCSRSWVDSSPWALVPLQGDTRTRDPMPEFLQAPTSPWSQSLPGLDHACLAASGLTPPPMTRHTMPVCFTHWLQGWPDVYQAGDTEPCFVCQRLPRPHADVAELTMTPAATLTTLQPAGALSPCRHCDAGLATAHLGLHETLGAGLTGRLGFPMTPAAAWRAARIFRAHAWRTGCLILDAAGAGLSISGGRRSGPKWEITRFVRPIKFRGTSVSLRPRTCRPLAMCHKLWIWKPWIKRPIGLITCTCKRRPLPVQDSSCAPDLDSSSSRLLLQQSLHMSHSGPNSGDRLSNTDDNLLAPTKLQTQRVTQSVGVRVGSGSHLLSGLKPTFTVGDRKPWHEQLNLLLITGTAPRSSLRTCMHGRYTQIGILLNTLPDSSIGPGWSHGGCLHSCLGSIPLPRREWSQDWLTALRYAWSVLLPTSPRELYFYFLCHQRIPLGLTLIWVPALLYLVHVCRKKSLPRSRRRSDHPYTPADSIAPVRRCERVSNLAVSRTHRPILGTSLFAPGSRWLLALILLTQVCNICGAPIFTSESSTQTAPSRSSSRT